MVAESCIWVKVEGRVQGVGYRAWVRSEAVGRGVSGWVRNRSDGSVEIVFQGSRDTLNELVERMHSGPPLAEVRTVETKPLESSEPRAGFEILHSG